MVTKGQFLERPTLIPVGKEVLEGLSHRGSLRPPLLILPPAPKEGGMDHVVGAELSWAAASAGHATLRFNYRGVGASQGTQGDLDSLIGDAEAAIAVLEENVGAPGVALAAIGSSAAVALSLLGRTRSIEGITLVSPASISPSDLIRLEHPLLVVLGEKDDQLPRVALSAAVTEVGGTVEVVGDADRHFTKNLPMVGKAVTAWLARMRHVSG
jgi:alpha/beta superfamily hydrolase